MPKPTHINNFHMQYNDMTSQHWDSQSESYAGGDNLMTALHQGWDIEHCVEVKHWYAGMRFVKLYQFELARDGKSMTMPVIDNPYVVRFIEEEGITLIVNKDSTRESA